MNTRKQNLEKRLVSYLRRHPNASDTLGGIARFWLADGPVFASRREVEDVVSDLVVRGVMGRTFKPDGEWIYSRGSALPMATPEDSEGR